MANLCHSRNLQKTSITSLHLERDAKTSHNPQDAGEGQAESTNQAIEAIFGIPSGVEPIAITIVASVADGELRVIDPRAGRTIRVGVSKAATRHAEGLETGIDKRNIHRLGCVRRQQSCHHERGRNLFPPPGYFHRTIPGQELILVEAQLVFLYRLRLTPADADQR